MLKLSKSVRKSCSVDCKVLFIKICSIFKSKFSAISKLFNFISDDILVFFQTKGNFQDSAFTTWNSRYTISSKTLLFSICNNTAATRSQ